jgi:membrane protease YdiL (CAAX protease family)|tara:strand:+ start:320 stop:952 length:633 start_codon:yes stop_codon:yes gene_type:complete
LGLFYFIFFIPLWKYFFSPINPWSQFFFEAFSTGIIFWAVFSKKLNLSAELPSISYFLRNSTIGVLLGVLILATLPCLSYFLLLLKAETTKFLVEKTIYPLINTSNSFVDPVKILLFAAIEQIVFLGVFIQPLLKRYNSIIIVYLAGLLFPLLHLKLTLNYFGMGLISGALLVLTGSIIPAIFFQFFSGLTKILLIDQYPELIKVLIILF